MKISVVSELPTLDACIGTHFRCSKYLLIIDLDTMEYEAMPNPVIVLSGPAAGKLFAQQLLQENVRIVLAGSYSSKISKSFLKALGGVGIQIIGGMSGSIRSAVKQFKEICLADTIIMPIEDVQS